MFVLVNLRTYTRSRLVNTLLLLCASVCGCCPHIRPQKHAKVQIYFFITKSFDKKAPATCQLFTFLHLHVANRCAYVRVYIFSYVHVRTLWLISLGLTCFQFAFAYVLPSSHHLLGISGNGGLRSPQMHEADSV